MPKLTGYNEAQRTPLPKEYDRRRKLTDDDKDTMRNLYATGEGIRAIARRFEAKCSRRMVQFVIFPERLKTVNYPGHWKRYRPTKEKWAEVMKTHRAHKMKVYKEGIK